MVIELDSGTETKEIFGRRVTLSVTRPSNERPNFGSGGWILTHKGQKSFSVEIEFENTVDTAGIDKFLWDAFEADTSMGFKVRADNAAAVDAKNPSYEGQIDITEFQPLSGALAEKSMVTVTWPGNGPLTRIETVAP